MSRVGRVVIGGVIGVASVFGVIIYNAYRKALVEHCSQRVFPPSRSKGGLKVQGKGVEHIDDVELPIHILKDKESKSDVCIEPILDLSNDIPAQQGNISENKAISEELLRLLLLDPIPYVVENSEVMDPVTAMRNQHYKIVGEEYLKEYDLPYKELSTEQFSAIATDFGRQILMLHEKGYSQAELLAKLEAMESFCRLMGADFGESYDEGSVLLTYLYVLLRYSRIQYGEGYRMPPKVGIMTDLCDTFGYIYEGMIAAIAYTIYGYLNLVNRGNINISQLDVFTNLVKQLVNVGDV